MQRPDMLFASLRLVLVTFVSSITFVGCSTESGTSSDTEDLPISQRDEQKTENPPASSVEAGDSISREAKPGKGAIFEEVVHPELAKCRYDNGEQFMVSSIVESLGGGVGVADYDCDGWPDLFFPGGGTFTPPTRVDGLPSQLLRNDGMQFRNVSDASRIAHSSHYSHGASMADVDNDGFTDCLVTGYGGLQLWLNQGDGTFVEAAAASELDDDQWSSSAAWADVDGDGNLDLYVCHYVNWSFDNNPSCPTNDPGAYEICSPRDFEGLDDVLYVSDGAGGYRDATQQWGLVAGGKGLGVVAGDVNADGKIDFYVANDTVENFLYVNQGNRFEEAGTVAGVAVDDQGIPNGSMGVEFGDLTGDLRPDLWCANYERESFALYRNEGAGLFLHVSRPTGITALGGLFVGFGSAFLDADHDGDLDIAVVNGHVLKYPQFAKREQKPLLLINGRPRFLKSKFESEHYFEQVHEGRGLATGDFDRDGHLDLVATHVNNSPSILLNHVENSPRSLRVQLIGTASNRCAIGSQATLTCSGGQFLRTINGGGSYLSTHEKVLVFELPEGMEPQLLEIRWPSGKTSKVTFEPSLSRELTLVEPQGLQPQGLQPQGGQPQGGQPQGGQQGTAI